MSSNRKRHSTNDSWRLHPYLIGLPTQELDRALIVRESTKPDSHVKVIRNGVIILDSRKRIGI